MEFLLRKILRFQYALRNDYHTSKTHSIRAFFSANATVARA
jgi:hypothetical protein